MFSGRGVTTRSSVECGPTNCYIIRLGKKGHRLDKVCRSIKAPHPPSHFSSQMWKLARKYFLLRTTVGFTKIKNSASSSSSGAVAWECSNQPTTRKANKQKIESIVRRPPLRGPPTCRRGRLCNGSFTKNRGKKKHARHSFEEVHPSQVMYSARS